MLTFAYATTGDGVTRECLGYQSQAMRYIRERMNSLSQATSVSTIGAILLLAGVEVCEPSLLLFPSILSSRLRGTDISRI